MCIDLGGETRTLGLRDVIVSAPPRREKLQFEGEDNFSRHFAYRLFVDHRYEVICLAYWRNHGNSNL